MAPPATVRKPAAHAATRRTVLVAGAANVVVAAAKLTAGLLSGSSGRPSDEPGRSAVADADVAPSGMGLPLRSG